MTIDRREFMGATATGVGSAVLGAGILGAGTTAFAQAHQHERTASDPVLALLLQESARLHKDMTGLHGPRGEHARRQAALMRMFAAHGQQVGLDRRIADSVRATIEQHGRETVLETPFDREKIAAELATLGVTLGAPLTTPADLTRERRAAVLDSMLREGATPVLTRTIAVLERTALELDRRYGAARQPAMLRVQVSCADGWDLIAAPLQVFIAIMCWNPMMWEICVMLALCVVTMEIMSALLCP